MFHGILFFILQSVLVEQWACIAEPPSRLSVAICSITVPASALSVAPAFYFAARSLSVQSKATFSLLLRFHGSLGAARLFIRNMPATNNYLHFNK